jgi:hypothetical protein
MVSSVVPGAAGAGAFGVDPRLARTPTQAGAVREDKAAPQDRVELSGPAALNAARESVSKGLAEVQGALSVGRDAQAAVLKVRDLAADPSSNNADLSAVLQEYDARFAAAAQTNSLVRGESISVNAEPGGPPLTIAGANFALGGDVVGVSGAASLADSGLGAAAQRSLDQLQSAMEKLSDASSALEAHQGFLGAAQSAVSGVTDLNADSARLLALQVRQGLETAGGRAIANAEPQAVLALFRA